MQMQEEIFFTRINDKWSPAEQLQHLILSVRPLQMAYGLPGIILQIAFGKSNRIAYTYEQLKERYDTKIKAGAKASNAYIPKIIKTKKSQPILIDEFIETHRLLTEKINYWNEAKLDKYVLPHPLLGKITLREMIYFTIFHIEHHHISIKKIYTKTNE